MGESGVCSCGCEEVVFDSRLRIRQGTLGALWCEGRDCFYNKRNLFHHISPSFQRHLSSIPKNFFFEKHIHHLFGDPSSLNKHCRIRCSRTAQHTTPNSSTASAMDQSSSAAVRVAGRLCLRICCPYLAHLLSKVFEVRLPFRLFVLVLRWLHETTERKVPLPRFGEVLCAWTPICADVRVCAVTLRYLQLLVEQRQRRNLPRVNSSLFPSAASLARTQVCSNASGTSPPRVQRSYGAPRGARTRAALTWIHCWVNSTR